MQNTEYRTQNKRQTTDNLKQKRLLFLISAGLVLATLIAYEPIRKNSFLSYDDEKYITQNSVVQDGLTINSITWALTKSHFHMWHPLTSLSHILDCELFGLNPLGHHLVNLIIHIINALLLFWILTNLTGSTWASAFAAGVFALHPLQVESVAWAAERKTVLSGLFWLLTMAVYIWYTKKPGIGRYILVFGTYVLCIMTKPVVVTLPFVLLLLDYWPLERLRTKNIEHRMQKEELEYQRGTPGRLIIEKIPLLALSGILAVMTVISQRGGEVIISLKKLPLGHRIANMFISYTRYIGKMIWPSKLAVPYPISTISPTSAVTIGCAVLFVLLLILSIVIGRRKRYLATGWLWFVVALVPMIGLVQVGGQSMADRYMYLSMIGLLFIIAWGVKDITGNHLRLRGVASVSGCASLLILAMITHKQTGYWRNNLTLFEHTLKVTRSNPFAEHFYGSALMNEGRFKEAEPHLRRAFFIDPGFSQARNNLGVILLEQKKVNEAIACFKELVRRDKSYKEGYFNLAAALGQQGNYDESIKYFSEVLKLEPNYPETHGRMGAVLLTAGRPKEAVSHLNEALQTSRDRMEVYVNLAMAYNQLGDYERAIQSRSKAMELNTDKPETLNNLAWLLATSSDVSAKDAARSVELAIRACELTKNKDPEVLDTLAATYAAAGRFADAVETSYKAVDIAKATGRKDIINEIEGRIKLYQAGQRYQQK